MGEQDDVLHCQCLWSVNIKPEHFLIDKPLSLCIKYAFQYLHLIETQTQHLCCSWQQYRKEFKTLTHSLTFIQIE